jgi:hypothetical protein
VGILPELAKKPDWQPVRTGEWITTGYSRKVPEKESGDTASGYIGKKVNETLDLLGEYSIY